ncbi:MAG TPA: CHAT domain-containing protein [Blastocatellia bacterium]|nr:CHAT domain-containing protein [Blastocatellia bacterium]
MRFVTFFRSCFISLILPFVVLPQTLVPTNTTEANLQTRPVVLVEGQSVYQIVPMQQPAIFQFSLKAGQYAEIQISRSSFGVRAELLAPSQQVIRQLTEQDWGQQFISSLHWVGTETGVYRLSLSIVAENVIPNLPTGYGVTVEALRDIQSADVDRLAAYELLAKARQVRTQKPDGKKLSVPHYQLALARAKQTTLPLVEAQVLFESGWLDYDQGNKQSAIEKHQAALSIFRQANRTQDIARTLSNLAYMISETNQMQSAQNYYEEAIRLFTQVNDPLWTGMSLSRYATFTRDRGNLTKAIELQTKALRARQSAAEQDGEIISMANLARLYYDHGEQEKAFELCRQALQLPQLKHYAQAETLVHNALGRFYQLRGQPQQAINHYQRVLSLLANHSSSRDEAAANNNLGSVYRTLGNYQQAIVFFERALAIERQLHNLTAEATILGNLGLAHRGAKLYEQSLGYYQQALAIQQRLNNRISQISVYNYLGGIYHDLERYAESQAAFQRSLEIYEQLGRPEAQKAHYAVSLVSLGNIAWRSGQREQALDYLQRGLTAHQEQNYPLGQVEALTTLARIYFSLNNWQQAESAMTASLAVIESVREQLVNPTQRASFNSLYQATPSVYLDMLMQATDSAQEERQLKALQLVERTRARSLLAMLSEARLDLRRDVDNHLLEKERAARARLNRKSAEKNTLVNSKHTPSQVKAMDDEIVTLTNELNFIENEIRTTSSRYASLTLASPLTTSEIQQFLDSQTVLLEYAFGEKGAYLWAITPTAIQSYRLAPQAEIQTAARELYRALAQSQQNAEAWQTEANKLSRYLLAPIAQELKSAWRGKRFLIVAPEALQYLPFGVLPIPQAETKQPASPAVALLERHEIVALPSASVLTMLRKMATERSPARQSVAVIADPIFSADDARVKTSLMRRQRQSPITETNETPSDRASFQLAVRSVTGDDRASLQRLPFSRDEAEAITAVAPVGGVMKALDFQASRATALSDQLAQYRIVHFATHGLLDSSHPELSGLALSLVDESGNPQDGYLRLNEIYNLKLNADLVVLSACQTGIGKEVKGEGLVGLTRGFMYAGTPRVVASLWQVNDAATAELMKRFYRGMLKEKLRPAAALRQAQLELMKKPAWRAPYYWSAFVLQGEWK